MNTPGPSTIALVCGCKESGKTRIVKRGLARVRRFVVWDVRGEYAHPELGVPGARLWLDMAHFKAHLLNGGTIEREVFACPSPQFKAWCKWVFDTGNLFVVVEEIARLCPNGRATPELLNLIERSRHCNIDLVATTARVLKVPIDLRAQVDDLLLSSMSEPKDLNYISSWLGEPVCARVKSLPSNTFLRIRP